jgi:integrase
MPALIEQALQARRDAIKPATWTQYQTAARKLSSILVEFSPEQVTQRDIVQIRMAMAKTPNMANRCLTVLRVVFDYALEMQRIESNPVIGIKRFSERQRDRLLSPDEYRRIYEHADPRLQVTMDLCYLTGQRISDVLGIRYTDLTDDGIAFKQAKTGSRLLVGWSPELRAVVDRAKSLHGNVRAFTLLHTRRGTAPAYQTVRDQWRDAVEASGVTNANLHDLRAMSATAAEAAGINATALLGHTSPSMTRRYLRSKQTPVVHGPSFRQASKKAS